MVIPLVVATKSDVLLNIVFNRRVDLEGKLVDVGDFGCGWCHSDGRNEAKRSDKMVER